MSTLDKDNIVQLFGYLKNDNVHDKILELLKTENKEFQALIEKYQNAKALDDRDERRAFAIEILKFEIHNPLEFVIKITVLQNELGFREGRRSQDVMIDELMFVLFKKSLVGCIEKLLFEKS